MEFQERHWEEPEILVVGVVVLLVGVVVLLVVQVEIVHHLLQELQVPLPIMEVVQMGSETATIIINMVEPDSPDISLSKVLIQVPQIRHYW